MNPKASLILDISYYLIDKIRYAGKIAKFCNIAIDLDLYYFEL